MKNKLIFFIFCFLMVWVFWSFYYVNLKNYEKIKEAESEIINHPEMLPKKEFANLVSFWFSNFRADIYWLETIQYIWWNALASEYKKYLFQMLDLITELNPYFEKPYIIWQLLLPNYNDRYENLSEKDQNFHNKKWEEIWLKWIKNFCDKKKIEKIIAEDDLEKIWTDPEYKNPCSSFQIPFWQWFLYYFYLKDNLTSSNYYKIASAQDDALDWAKVMAAIMRWKWGDREKSSMMFLTLAKAWKQDDNCKIFSWELEKVIYATFRENIPLNWEVIKNIEDLRKEYFPFDKENEEKTIMESNCGNYINKTVRELNLYYLEEANKKYLEKTWKNASNAKELFEKWYINFLPTDFQQYDTYWIVYEFNSETWNFDYKMWN